MKTNSHDEPRPPAWRTFLQTLKACLIGRAKGAGIGTLSRMSKLIIHNNQSETSSRAIIRWMRQILCFFLKTSSHFPIVSGIHCSIPNSSRVLNAFCFSTDVTSVCSAVMFKVKKYSSTKVYIVLYKSLSICGRSPGVVAPRLKHMSSGKQFDLKRFRGEENYSPDD